MILETERLLLKPYELEFAEEIYQVVKQKEIADTTVMIPHPYPREVVDSWVSYLQKSFEWGICFCLLIHLMLPNIVLGTLLH